MDEMPMYDSTKSILVNHRACCSCSVRYLRGAMQHVARSLARGQPIEPGGDLVDGPLRRQPLQYRRLARVGCGTYAAEDRPSNPKFMLSSAGSCCCPPFTCSAAAFAPSFLAPTCNVLACSIRGFRASWWAARWRRWRNYALWPNGAAAASTRPGRAVSFRDGYFLAARSADRRGRDVFLVRGLDHVLPRQCGRRIHLGILCFVVDIQLVSPSGRAAPRTAGRFWQRRWWSAIAYVAFMCSVDIPMYASRWLPGRGHRPRIPIPGPGPGGCLVAAACHLRLGSVADGGSLDVPLFQRVRLVQHCPGSFPEISAKLPAAIVAGSPEHS